MARPKTALLSRAAIAEAAIALVDAGEDLQVIPLAKALGVSPSSLYHHVDGRDGIIHAMREVLSARYATPNVDGLDWEERLRKLVASLGRLYLDHPQVLQLLLTVVIEEPLTLELYEQLAEALRDGGVPEDELLTTLETLDAFAFGVALDSLSPESIFARNRVAPQFDELIDRHPVGEARNRRLFEHGLELLISGIRARFAPA